MKGLGLVLISIGTAGLAVAVPGAMVALFLGEPEARDIFLRALPPLLMAMIGGLWFLHRAGATG